MKSLIAAVVLVTSLPALALPPIALQGVLAVANFPCLPLTPAWSPQSGNLLHVWHLDDVNGTTSAADSVGGNTALTSSIPSSVVNEHIGKKSLNNNSFATGLFTTNLVADPTAMTYTAWVKTSSFAGGGIIGYADTQTETATNWDRNLAMTTSGQFIFGFWNGGNVSIISPLPYNDGNWHHVAVTYNNGAIVLYVDGTSVASSSSAAALPYSGYFRIATAYLAGWPGFPPQGAFDGKLDEIGIWSTALTAGDIAALAAAPAEVSSSHPQWANTYGIYHFSETSGNYLDASGHGNNTSALPTKPASTAGFYGNGINATTGNIMSYTTSTQSTSPQVFSLMSWFKTNSTDGGVLIEYGGQQTGGLSNYDRFIAMENDGKIVFGVNGGTSVARSTLSYNDNKWHHVIATFTPGSQIVYVDGLQVATASGPDAENFNGWWRIADGKLVGWVVTTNGTLFHGYLDEVAIWNSVLLPAEVTKIYRSQRCGVN